jgi:hypothetical protein
VSAGTDPHERTLSIETRPLEGERLGVRGELLDVRRIEMPGYPDGFHPAGLVHDMALDVELDRSLRIVEIDATMRAIPFQPSERTRGEGCRDVLPNYSNPRAGSCHMWRLDGPLVGLERSLNLGESV